MLIHGSPLSVDLPADPSLHERFWYWHGASGRKYIHSIYEPDACPPLPGAVFVGVKRQGTIRVAVCVGRFRPFWDGMLVSADLKRLAADGLDEVHVHLLAKSPEVAEAIYADLSEAFEDRESEVETAWSSFSPMPVA